MYMIANRCVVFKNIVRLHNDNIENIKSLLKYGIKKIKIVTIRLQRELIKEIKLDN